MLNWGHGEPALRKTEKANRRSKFCSQVSHRLAYYIRLMVQSSNIKWPCGIMTPIPSCLQVKKSLVRLTRRGNKR